MTSPPNEALPIKMADDHYTINGTDILQNNILAALTNTTVAPNESGDQVTTLLQFANIYRPIHGIAAPIICVLGIIANCLNIVVLTRKNMVSPTNILLTWLAISDGLTMLAYFPYAILNYHIYTHSSTVPLANARFIMFYAIFSVIVHSISIWLTVSLAVFRYVFISYPRRGAKLCSIYRAKLTVFIVCVVVTLVCIPNSIMYKFDSYPSGPDANETSWYITIKMDTEGFRFLKNFNLWIQAILVKLLPCLLLAILSLLLIKQMNDAEKRRKKLMNNKNKSDDDSRRHRKTNRTTRMLVVVVVLFVITETPQGILQLLAGIISSFFDRVYNPLGDLMDTIALFNNGINFVLYCTMSKQFRDTFIKIFIQDFVSGSKRTPNTTAQTTDAHAMTALRNGATRTAVSEV